MKLLLAMITSSLCVSMFQSGKPPFIMISPAKVESIGLVGYIDENPPAFKLTEIDLNSPGSTLLLEQIKTLKSYSEGYYIYEVMVDSRYIDGISESGIKIEVKTTDKIYSSSRFQPEDFGDINCMLYDQYILKRELTYNGNKYKAVLLKYPEINT